MAITGDTGGGVTTPIQSYIKYFNRIKPYHTKILEVLEEYRFQDNNAIIDDGNSTDVQLFANFTELVQGQFLTPTPTISITPTNSVTPTLTATVTATIVATATITVTPTPSPTSPTTATPMVTGTPVLTPPTTATATPTVTATVTPPVTVTSTPALTVTATPTPTITPTRTSTPAVTLTPTITPTPSALTPGAATLGGNTVINNSAAGVTSGIVEYGMFGFGSGLNSGLIYRNSTNNGILTGNKWWTWSGNSSVDTAGSPLSIYQDFYVYANETTNIANGVNGAAAYNAASASRGAWVNLSTTRSWGTETMPDVAVSSVVRIFLDLYVVYSPGMVPIGDPHTGLVTFGSNSPQIVTIKAIVGLNHFRV